MDWRVFMKPTIVLVFVALAASLPMGRNGRAAAQNAVSAFKSPQDIASLLAKKNQIVTLPPPAAKVKQAIERGAEVYRFSSGDSRAILFELPSFVKPYVLTIHSLCNCGGPSKSVFVPRIAFLDGQFSQTGMLEDDNFFIPDPRSGFLEAKINVDADRRADRYLLVFTRGELVGKELATLTIREGLINKFKLHYPYLRAAFGTVEIEISLPKAK
jgi:hypothetical protein